MNIYMQLCGVILVLLLMLLYQSHRTLGLPGEKTFMRIVLFTLLNLLLDIISVIAIHYRASLPGAFVEVCCKAYPISIIWLGGFELYYVLSEMTADESRRQSLLILICSVSMAGSVVTAALPVYLFEEGSAVYSYGPAIIAVYMFALVYVLSSLIISIYIYKKRNSRRGLAMTITSGIWAAAASIQFFNNELLIVGFACAVGAMVLYIVMENPDAFLDRQLGCFNAHAFYEYLTLLMQEKRRFHLLDLSVTDISPLENKGIDVKNLTKDIVAKVGSDKELYLFKNFSYGLVAASENEEKLKDLSARLPGFFSAYGEDIRGETLIFTLKDAQRFENADEALRFLTHFRRDGADRRGELICVSDEAIAQFRNAKKIEKEIVSALEEDRVEAFLQPIYGLKETDGISAEALVRIRMRDGSFMPPAEFIPVAEETGRIKELGERVLKKVCEFLRDTDAVALGLQSVDVNLSVIQCDDKNAPETLGKIVDAYNIPHSRIVFEITETAASTARDVLIGNMNELVSRGFRFALDDFGKGEANLVYLVKMPIKTLKLDMEMSRAYFSDPNAGRVVSGVIAMAHNMDLSIVIEGIETRKELEEILKEDVDYIQGYCYSHPLAMGDFLQYLKNSVQNKTEV